MKVSNKKIINATKWSSAAEIIAKLVSPIVNAVLARILLPSAFGTVATINLVITFAELFTDAGFQKYIIQHEFISEDELNNNSNVAFWTNFVFSLFIYCVIVFFRNPLAVLVGNSDLGDGIAVASFAIVLVAFSSIQYARYKRSLDFKTLFLVRITTVMIPLVVTIPLAVIFKNFWALILGMLVTKLVEASILLIKSPWKPSLFYSFNLLKEMLSFSVWTMFEAVTVWFTQYIGVFIVGNVLNEYYLGIYQTAITTVNSYMNIITAAIIPVILSALSRLQNDEEEFQKSFYQFQKWVALLVIPMSLGLYIYRDLVTDILLGDQWKEASQLIGLWSLSSGFTIVFSNFSSIIYISKGKPRISVWSHLLHLMFLIPVIYFAAKEGFVTLSIVRSFARIQGIIINLIILRIVFHISIKKMMKNIVPYTITALFMSIFVMFLQKLSGHILWSVFSIGLGIMFYIGTCILIPSVRRDLYSVVKQIKPIRNLMQKCIFKFRKLFADLRRR